MNNRVLSEKPKAKKTKLKEKINVIFCLNVD
jgi:hypothetical protein